MSFDSCLTEHALKYIYCLVGHICLWNVVSRVREHNTLTLIVIISFLTSKFGLKLCSQDFFLWLFYVLNTIIFSRAVANSVVMCFGILRCLI